MNKKATPAKKDAQLLDAVHDLVMQDKPQNLRFELDRILRMVVATPGFADLPPQERGDIISSYVSLGNFLFKLEAA